MYAYWCVMNSLARCDEFSSKNCPPHTYCGEVGGVKVCMSQSGKSCSIGEQNSCDQQLHSPSLFTCVYNEASGGECITVNDAGKPCSENHECGKKLNLNLNIFN